MADRPRDRLGRPLPPGSSDELAGRIAPEAAGATVEQAARRATELFDAERFFEAHEWFEYVWKRPDVPAADRRFWRGLAQLAVGCCHWQRGNLAGAAAVLARAATNLAGYPDPHCGVDVPSLVRAADALAACARTGGTDAPAFPHLR